MLSISFGGDVMFDRQIRKRLETDSLHDLLTPLSQVWQKTDHVILNFETVSTDTPTPLVKQFCFNSDPVHLQVLRNSGTTHLNLANNHSVDHGVRGLERTLRNIRKQKITPLGAGLGNSACEPIILSNGVLKVAVFSSVLLPLEQWFNNQGKMCLCVEQPETLAERIADYAKEHPEHHIILQLHWGGEYQSIPVPQQMMEAKSLIKAGVDLIVGHHPHIWQRITYIDDVPVVFSIGNLIFDSSREWTDHTGMLKTSWNKDGLTSLSIEPFMIKGGFPQEMKNEDRSRFVNELNRIASGATIVDQEDETFCIRPQ